MSVDPGKLRSQVTFQEKTVTGQDSYGQQVYTWSTVFTGWCEVRGMAGRELEAAQQLHAEARFKIRTHYPPTTIKREWRAVWGDRVLDILDCEDPEGKRREVVLLAKEFTE